MRLGTIKGFLLLLCLTLGFICVYLRHIHLLSVKSSSNVWFFRSDVRVLCLVITGPQNLEKKAKYVQMTWAPLCDKHIFISSETNSTFPTIGVNTSEGRDHLTEKTMLGFEYVYKYHLNDADWFLKADDDTYVVVENLKYFLSNQNTEEPVYFGRHFKRAGEQDYFSGGAGYVVSKEALRRFGEHGCASKYNMYPQTKPTNAEDVIFSRCLQTLGVKIGNSTDKYGRSRFHCFNVETHLQGYYPEWYYSKSYDTSRGTESISRYPISFHYMSGKMLSTHHLLYHAARYGREAYVSENINRDRT